MVSSLTREDERTNLAEVSSWSPEEKPEILFMLYDVGGQESYKNTTHIFQVCTASIVLHLNLRSNEKSFISRIFDSSYVLSCGRDFKLAV